MVCEDLAVNEAMEFTRTVGAPRAAAEEGGNKNEIMGDDEDDVKVELPPPPPPPSPPPKPSSSGRYEAEASAWQSGHLSEHLSAVGFQRSMLCHLPCVLRDGSWC